ncbi:hypothetical protein [Flintibacter muris]|uniref:hypothetical protein n=1 Tax=Flintibacter muris TaxID=2941327 RepID=UPI00203C60E2|nr:hypothetical protein [Flintibacter muris]
MAKEAVGMEDGCENGLDIRLYCDTLAWVLEEQYGVKLVCTPRPKARTGEETEQM